MIRFRIISLQTGVILVFLLWLISLDLFEPHSNPTRYPLNQRILGARTCHMQLVNRVIDSCLKVVNLDSNHHQVLCAFLLPPPFWVQSIVRWFPISMCAKPNTFPPGHVPSGTYDSVSWDYDDFLYYQRFCNFYCEIWDCHFAIYASISVV